MTLDDQCVERKVWVNMLIAAKPFTLMDMHCDHLYARWYIHKYSPVDRCQMHYKHIHAVLLNGKGGPHFVHSPVFDPW